jgi:opacity protein-like surface antigen
MKHLSVMTVIAGVLCSAAAARAQTPSPRSPGEIFLNINASGQVESRTFTTGGTIVSFNEVGRFEANQNIGKAIVFDVNGGYQFGQHMGFAVGVWTARSKSAVAATATVPDPVFFGRFTTVNPTVPTDLKQTAIGFDLDFIYTLPLTDRVDFSLSAGPTFLHVSQDVASVQVTPNSTAVSVAVESQSKSTGKAGNVGVDISYRFTEHYGGGLFARYAGGEVDLPAVSKLKVGGIQVGGGVRFRF